MHVFHSRSCKKVDHELNRLSGTLIATVYSICPDDNKAMLISFVAVETMNGLITNVMFNRILDSFLSNTTVLRHSFTEKMLRFS